MAEEVIASAELVGRFTEACSRHDLDAALECIGGDFEFDWSGSMGPFNGIYRGSGELKRFWNELFDAWDEFSLEIEETEEQGPEELVTVTAVRGRGKGSGVVVEARGAMLWTVRDGVIRKGKLFQSKEDALEALEPKP